MPWLNGSRHMAVRGAAGSRGDHMNEPCAKPKCHRPRGPRAMFCQPCFDREERLAIMIESAQVDRDWAARVNK